jgi:tRNA(fMet)-specific endonuclease VapC
MTVLDMDILTLLEYGRSAALDRRVESALAADSLAVAVISRMERLQGRFDSILKAANETELLDAMMRFRVTQSFLDRFGVLEVNEAAAGHFERLRKDRKVKMRRPDMLIACIALANDALLVTRNVKDYRQVTGLRVENWVD